MNLLNRLAKLLKTYPMKSIFFTIIIVIILAVGIQYIYMATGNDTLVKTNTDVYQDNEMFEQEFGEESVIVLYKSDRVLTPLHLKHMKGIEHALQTSGSIYSKISPVTLVEEIAGKQSDTFQEGIADIIDGLGEMGEELQTISENMETIYDYSDIMTPGLPKKQATLDNMVFDDGKLRPMFEEVIVDDQHMLMMIKFNGDTDDTEKSEVVETINNYLEAESIDSLETIVSGKPVLDNAIRSSMQENIQKMMGLALLIMVVVLFLVFKVHWRLLPLLTVLVAVVGTVGLMGWLKIPITMVSMAVFPILIGLGIDYAIQFQNRYDEEMSKEDSNE